MFISIIGTPYSGKSTVENYLISERGFTSVRISSNASPDLQHDALKENITFPSHLKNSTLSTIFDSAASENEPSKHISFYSSSPLPSSTPSPKYRGTLFFLSAAELLKFVTDNWQDNFVTRDLHTWELVKLFIRRPFFLLVYVEAPLFTRFERVKRHSTISLEEFVKTNDEIAYGTGADNFRKDGSTRIMSDLVNVFVTNTFAKISDLYLHLDNIDLLDPAHLRPGWDAYFMTLASLASRRSNCMKRRVGAVIVRENRVLATGYNGTPRGLLNCNEGGCPHCNGTVTRSAPYDCICLHAEENALLEAGRERIGDNAVLYCNTCPCLKCTIKIIQTGVKSVVYNLTYKVDDASALLFKQAGVQLRRYDPSGRARLPTGDDQLDTTST
ncbi:cytidine deaminase-like protein [Cyathus striatus]|nr:cytidine deaminase-like protein [Cyathus striatus]